jgi:aspartyl protease family protein
MANNSRRLDLPADPLSAQGNEPQPQRSGALQSTRRKCALLMNLHLCLASIALGLLASTGATAMDINVVGLFPNKAVVQIEDGALRTLSVGQKIRDDIILLSVGRDGATFNIRGRSVVLALGTGRAQTNPSAATNDPSATNYAKVPTNAQGDLVADGEVNGMPVRFFVDTGATFITIPAREASRLGLDFRNGRKIVMETVNGDVLGYRLKLDTVRVGGIDVDNVEAVVIESKSLSSVLLGMSFLNRVDFRREGATLTLTKR